MSPTSFDAQASTHDDALFVDAERALRGPLGVLRVLFEGVEPSLRRRATREVDRAERAAGDLARLVRPRELRAVQTTLAEIVRSTREGLDAAERQRCHVAVDAAETPLHLDGRILVDALVRSMAERLSRSDRGELMLHAHADENSATLNLIDTEPPSVRSVVAIDPSTRTSVAHTLLLRDVERIGGRASVHVAGDHQCSVIVVPSAGRALTGIEGGAA